MIDAGTLLQSTASRERRREILHNCRPETLEKMKDGFEKWDVNFPMGRTLAHECADELERRRLAAEDE